MSESPQIIQCAASFDWETLLPVVFFVLYGLAQFFGSKKKGEAAEEEINPEEDPMEKARQIREEIRRKIEERKQASQQGRASPQQAYDPNLPESRQSSASPSTQQSQPAHESRPVVVHQARTIQAKSPVSGVEQQLIEQRKRLREARKQHDAALVQARKMTNEASVKRQADSRKLFEHESVPLDSSTQLRTAVLSGLRHPNSLRKAVLYREILDPPIALR
ncbi:hypothetical protein G0Q06_06830 [Puniceicoccales bacterium CK1056]|uniref:Uncharacterized protein n=1 Tax=Oceanipulchritudo coccoides TaxID=2706888 RepID=A0A6B2M1A9_9BACT|nr:hypothetical protein [Oceanipulchritudo coccoides]NDV62156.1 hypothetical protein [Oceanipulchritudo coccoides]